MNSSRYPGSDISEDSVAFTVCIGQGMATELPEQASFSHLAEHVLAESLLIDGERLRTVLFEAGIEVAARTYPFHIELTLSCEPDDAVNNEELIRRVVSLWTHPHSLVPSFDEIHEARSAIAEEVSARQSHSILASFPWSVSASLCSASCVDGHDGFTNLSRLHSEDLLPRFHEFLRGLSRCSVGVGIGGNASLLPQIFQAALVEDIPYASPTFLSACVSSLRQKQPRISRAVAADLFDFRTMWGEHSPELGVVVAATLRYLLADIDPDAIWTAGTFGAFHGPDFAIFSRTSFCSVSRNRPPWSLTLPLSVNGTVDHDILRRAALLACEEFQALYADPLALSSLRARGNLFGIDDAEVGRMLTSINEGIPSVFADLVVQTLNTISSRTAQGSLIWEPTA